MRFRNHLLCSCHHLSEENRIKVYWEKKCLQKEDFESSIVRPNAVYLFGPFTVIDRNGRDITHLFSSRLRQVFIYILLHSTHNGVLSASLNEVFWADKPDDKVKNLKGVTINQIRKNLAELDGVELVHDKGYFRLVFTDCYCDYFRFRTLKNAEEVENELGILLMRGKFLDGMDAGDDGPLQTKSRRVLVFLSATGNRTSVSAA